MHHQQPQGEKMQPPRPPRHRASPEGLETPIPKMRGRTCSCGENSCQVNRAQVERDVLDLAAGSDALIEVLNSGGDRPATLPALSAAEQSCAGVDAAMPARRSDSDVVSIEGLPVAPWVPLMLNLVIHLNRSPHLHQLSGKCAARHTTTRARNCSGVCQGRSLLVMIEVNHPPF